MQHADLETFSDLIGSIYDSAVDPTLWHSTMQRVSEALDCFHCSLFEFDFALLRSRVRIAYPRLEHAWRDNPDVVSNVGFLFRNNPGPLMRGLDEPIVMSRDAPSELLDRTPALIAWQNTVGIVDSIQAIVSRDQDKLGVFAANRHKSVGVASEREINFMRLLAPHLRRAMAISNLIDMRALTNRALGATLDSLSCGVVVVADDARILHANVSASLMFSNNTPVSSDGGRLSATRPEATHELRRAIDLARTNETGLGPTGIGVVLPFGNGDVAVAHVLPLARGDIRTKLVPHSTAAVFITMADQRLPTDLTAIARSFGLTPAERRLLERLVMGETLTEAATVLGVAETTAKTHLSHIFSKTAVTRQTDLIALIERLIPPIRNIAPPSGTAP